MGYDLFRFNSYGIFRFYILYLRLLLQNGESAIKCILYCVLTIYLNSYQLYTQISELRLL